MSRYEALFKLIKKEKPDFVFMGGDLLPHRNKMNAHDKEIDFVKDFLIRKFSILKDQMDCEYPELYLIPGNDDHKILFDILAEGEKNELWRNLHNHCIVIGKYRLYGYACVPPTPFMIKDWERYDIEKESGPGCIAPGKGFHSMPSDHDPENARCKWKSRN
jgi:Icc-related predicted phosphoesterase